jgi:hypothetical protein
MPPFLRAGFLGAFVLPGRAGVAGLGVHESGEGRGLTATTLRRAAADGLGLKLMRSLTGFSSFFIDVICRE